MDKEDIEDTKNPKKQRNTPSRPHSSVKYFHADDHRNARFNMVDNKGFLCVYINIIFKIKKQSCVRRI